MNPEVSEPVTTEAGSSRRTSFDRLVRSFARPLAVSREKLIFPRASERERDDEGFRGPDGPLFLAAQTGKGGR